MAIRLLDPLVIDQIAAGEVIERPASVVKELVENSLDAGARSLLIEIEGGGARLIRVRDDGGGVAPEDLPMVFRSHATSKLTGVEDLDRIASFGFRGEALASIGAVSRARILACREAGVGGYEITCEGGKLGQPRPAPSPPGTTVEVRELFFNTPARRRFLRSEASERGRIVDLVGRLALAHPAVGWVLREKGKDLLRLPVGASPEERIALVLGKELAGALERVEARRGEWAVSGFVARPDRVSFRDTRNQLVFVNGRIVRDRGLAAAAHKGLEEALMTGRRPGYVLFLELPPEQVDVNVHPAKTEVRFRNPALAFALVRDAVRPAAMGGRPPLPGPSVSQAGSSLGTRCGPGNKAAVVREQGPALFPSDLSQDSFRPKLSPGAPGPTGALPPPDPGPVPHLQVGGVFLVFADGDGLTLVDSHALHERVLYDRLIEALAKTDRVPAQRLLAPALFDAGVEDKAVLLGAREVLARLGFNLADFGQGTLAIESVPVPLSDADPVELIGEILLSLEEGQGARSRSLEERLASAACRVAVKSGRRLTALEVEWLLEAAGQARHPGHCPHGRPTTAHFTRADLEKLFRRTT